MRRQLQKSIAAVLTIALVSASMPAQSLAATVDGLSEEEAIEQNLEEANELDRGTEKNDAVTETDTTTYTEPVMDENAIVLPADKTEGLSDTTEQNGDLGEGTTSSGMGEEANNGAAVVMLNELNSKESPTDVVEPSEENPVESVIDSESTLSEVETTVVDRVATDSGTFSNGLSYAYDAGSYTLTISGEGPMTEPPSFKGSWHVKRLVIDEGITTVCDDAFSSYSARQYLEEISLPSTLTSIGDDAFYCTRITSITIPGSVESIGENAFNYNKLLKDVVISEGVSSIEKGAFSSCGELASVSLPESLQVIGDDAFKFDAIKNLSVGCAITSIGRDAFAFNPLVSVDLSGGVNAEICQEAFRDCESLETVSIGSGYVSIGDYAFCTTKLSKVSLPSTLKTIGNGAFSGGKTLQSINMPASVTSIGDYAFSGCTSLRNMKLPSRIASIGKAAFQGCPNMFGTKLDIPATVKTIGDNAFDTTASTGGDSEAPSSSVKQVEFLGDALTFKALSGVFRGFICKAIYPAGNKTYTEDVRTQDNHGGEFTWYSRHKDGSLVKDPYISSFYKIALGANGKWKSIWLEPDGYPIGGRSGCSFEVSLAKKSKVCFSLETHMDDECTHQQFVISIKDNDGKTCKSYLVTKSTTKSATLTLPAGKAHVEAVYFDSHNHYDSLISASCIVVPSQPISNAKVSTVSAEPYTGKAVKPTPTVKLGGLTLKCGTDYTITYKNNKKVGTASIIIKGKGIFTGKKTIKFKIHKSAKVKHHIYSSASPGIKGTTKVTKGTTCLYVQEACGYIRFKAPKTATYTFTFSDVRFLNKKGKDLGGKGKEGSAVVVIKPYGGAVTAKEGFPKVRTQGGYATESWQSLELLPVGFKMPWQYENDKLRDRPISSRYAKFKIKKGQIVYFELSSSIGNCKDCKDMTMVLNIK